MSDILLENRLLKEEIKIKDHLIQEYRTENDTLASKIMILEEKIINLQKIIKSVKNLLIESNNSMKTALNKLLDGIRDLSK